MTIEWTGMRVTVVGLAREGTALARFLAQRGAQVTVTDVKGPEALGENLAQLTGLPVRYCLGGHPSEVFAADVFFVSPGVPIDAPVVIEAQRRGIALSSETRLFTRLCRAPVVGVTGSSGKTTTVTLVGRMLEAAGLRTFVGGNIGQPLIGRVEEIVPSDRVVMELSSFQLEGFGPAQAPGCAFPPGGWSPHGAAILNVTPNHLDRHPSMEAYVAAKSNILRFQGKDDWAVLNADDPVTCGLLKLCAGQVLQFSLQDPVAAGAYLRGRDLCWVTEGEERCVCRQSDLRLRGRHNVANALAACAIAGAAGATVEAMRSVLTTFAGVEHRLELVRVLRGVAYYNDSIATSPERAIAALRSFQEPLVLLAGGRDKHLPWDGWARLVQERVREVVCFGEMAPMLAEVLARASFPGSQVHTCATVQEAVAVAARVARPGEVVLLSPGGTSFDAFVDFAARGQAFRSAVLELS